MKDLLLTVPCNFGLEAVVGRELKSLGFEIYSTTDGKVNFYSDLAGLIKANLWLRTGERVLIKMAEFEAKSFEELFQGVKKIRWAELLPVTAAFPVASVSALKSQLHSVPDIQAVVKKAAVESMRETYKQSWFMEDGAPYPILVQILKDKVCVYVDSSGASLHKRGYRLNKNLAPIKETLAAGMVSLMPWHPDRILVDPLCGSGTIVIEAALKGINRAPGIRRHFRAEKWDFIPEAVWAAARQEAKAAEKLDQQFIVRGYDIDSHVIKMARENAQLAGVADFVSFKRQDVRDFSSQEKYGFIVTNPPYGERLEDKASVEELYREMSRIFGRLDTWSYSIITAFAGFEHIWGRVADRRRKLYNGMIKTTLYQYFGPKPPKSAKDKKRPDRRNIDKARQNE
jgi:putative N6-adenine-specific DNA methylase